MQPTRFILCSLLLLSLVHGAQADMYVDRSIVVFEPGESNRQDVRISNTDDDVIYVQVEVFKVSNPGTEAEERVKITNPREIKLIVTPNKLVIPASGQKMIRMVNLDPGSDDERVYRINVTPVLPPLEEETSQLRIVVAYQILTIVQPKAPEASLAVEKNGKSIRFHNKGNTNILLSEGNQCATEEPEQCTSLDSRRLYAGNTWELALPYDTPVSFSVRSHDGIKREVFE